MRKIQTTSDQKMCLVRQGTLEVTDRCEIHSRRYVVSTAILTGEGRKKKKEEEEEVM